MELKEKRETQELDHQDLLASLDLLDPQDHEVCLMDQMPCWRTWTVILYSLGVLLVHQGLQDLLVSLDPTCHHLTPQTASLLGTMDRLVCQAETDPQEYMGYQVQQEKMGLLVYLELWERRVTKVYLGHLDKRVNVGP